MAQKWTLEEEKELFDVYSKLELWKVADSDEKGKWLAVKEFINANTQILKNREFGSTHMRISNIVALDDRAESTGLTKAAKQTRILFEQLVGNK